MFGQDTKDKIKSNVQKVLPKLLKKIGDIALTKLVENIIDSLFK